MLPLSMPLRRSPRRWAVIELTLPLLMLATLLSGVVVAQLTPMTATPDGQASYSHSYDSLPAVGVNAIISNYFVVGSSRFALLGNQNINDRSVDSVEGCDSTPSPLPSGWTVADETDDTFAAILSKRWQTVCVMLNSGKGYYSLQAKNQCIMGTSPVIVHQNGLYSVNSCSRRILISQPKSLSDVDTTVTPDITRFYVFDGYYFASADNFPYSNDDPGALVMPGCQDGARKIPVGWEPAPYDERSRIAIMSPRIRFSTTCLVFGTAASYNVFTQQDCGALTSVTFQTSAGTPQWYIGIGWCNRRALIRKKAAAGTPNSWKSVDVVTNFLVYNFQTIATIDNAESSYGISNDDKCQRWPQPIPPGWQLAAWSTEIANIMKNVFVDLNTSCGVFADGRSMQLVVNPSICLPGNQLLQVGQYFAPVQCDQRVIIQPSTDIGRGFCSMGGLGHVVTFDQTFFDFLGVGEFKLAESVDTSKPMSIQVRTQPFLADTSTINVVPRITAVAVTRAGVSVAVYGAADVASGAKTGEPSIFINNVMAPPLSDGTAVSLGISDSSLSRTGIMRVLDTSAVAGVLDLSYKIVIQDVEVSVMAVTTRAGHQLLHVYVWLYPSFNRLVCGICRNWDLDKPNDLTAAKATTSNPNNAPSYVEIDAYIRATSGCAQKLTAITSRFLYTAPYTGPDSYVVPSYAPRYPPNSCASSSDVAVAQQSCLQAGALKHSAITYSNCVNDVCLTRDNIFANVIVQISGQQPVLAELPASWKAGNWSSCSVVCGAGVQSRNVTCIRNGEVVANSICRTEMPSRSQSCKLVACRGKWSVVVGSCSVTCGVGLAPVTVTCVDIDSGNAIDEGQCGATKPSTSSVTCNQAVCDFAIWMTLAIGDCSLSCGGGFQSLAIYCAYSRTKTIRIDDSYCKNAGPQPPISQACNTHPCYVPTSWPSISPTLTLPSPTSLHTASPTPTSSSSPTPTLHSTPTPTPIPIATPTLSQLPTPSSSSPTISPTPPTSPTTFSPVPSPSPRSRPTSTPTSVPTSVLPPTTCVDVNAVSYFVTLNQFDYAVLDQVQPCIAEAGCHPEGTYLRVPQGWSIAPNISRHRLAVAIFPFATGCVIFEDGSSLSRSLNVCAKSGSLIKLPSDTMCVSVASSFCPSRILIARVSLSIINFVVNSSMQSRGSTVVGWTDTTGIVRSDSNASITPGSSSILMLPSLGSQPTSASQTISMSDIFPFSVSVWSRSAFTLLGSIFRHMVQIYVNYSDKSHQMYSIDFASDTTEWQQRTVNISPIRPILNIIISLIVVDCQGSVWFDNVESGPGDPNLIYNGNFDFIDRLQIHGFGRVGTHAVAVSTDCVSRYCVVLSLPKDSTSMITGLQQIALPTSTLPENLYSHSVLLPVVWMKDVAVSITGLFVSFMTKAISSTGSVGGTTWGSVVIDITFTDGSLHPGIYVTAPTTATTWTSVSRLVSFSDRTKTISSVVMYLLLREPGTVYFDNIGIYFTVGGIPTSCCPSGSSSAIAQQTSHGCSLIASLPIGINGLTVGLHHVKTLDSAMFTFNAIGEFNVVNDGILIVQSRLARVSNEVVACVTSSVSIRYQRPRDGVKVNLFFDSNDVSNSPIIVVDQTFLSKDLLNSKYYMTFNSNTGLIQWSHDGYRYSFIVYFFETGHSVTITPESIQTRQFFSLTLNIPDASRNRTNGLLGNFNGNPSDDLMATNSKATTRYLRGERHRERYLIDMSTAADMYRVTRMSSIFPYASGESTATYTDKEFTPIAENVGISSSPLSKKCLHVNENVATDITNWCAYDSYVSGDGNNSVLILYNGLAKALMAFTRPTVVESEIISTPPTPSVIQATPTSSLSSSSSTIIPIIAGTAGCLVIVFILIGVVLLVRRRKRNLEEPNDTPTVKRRFSFRVHTPDEDTALTCQQFERRDSVVSRHSHGSNQINRSNSVKHRKKKRSRSKSAEEAKSLADHALRHSNCSRHSSVSNHSSRTSRSQRRKSNASGSHSRSNSRQRSSLNQPKKTDPHQRSLDPPQKSSSRSRSRSRAPSQPALAVNAKYIEIHRRSNQQLSSRGTGSDSSEEMDVAPLERNKSSSFAASAAGRRSSKHSFQSKQHQSPHNLSPESSTQPSLLTNIANGEINAKIFKILDSDDEKTRTNQHRYWHGLRRFIRVIKMVWLMSSVVLYLKWRCKNRTLSSSLLGTLRNVNKTSRSEFTHNATSIAGRRSVNNTTTRSHARASKHRISAHPIEQSVPSPNLRKPLSKRLSGPNPWSLSSLGSNESSDQFMSPTSSFKSSVGTASSPTTLISDTFVSPLMNAVITKPHSIFSTGDSTPRSRNSNNYERKHMRSSSRDASAGSSAQNSGKRRTRSSSRRMPADSSTELVISRKSGLHQVHTSSIGTPVCSPTEKSQRRFTRSSSRGAPVGSTEELEHPPRSSSRIVSVFSFSELIPSDKSDKERIGSPSSDTPLASSIEFALDQRDNPSSKKRSSSSTRANSSSINSSPHVLQIAVPSPEIECASPKNRFASTSTAISAPTGITKETLLDKRMRSERLPPLQKHKNESDELPLSARTSISSNSDNNFMGTMSRILNENVSASLTIVSDLHSGQSFDSVSPPTVPVTPEAQSQISPDVLGRESKTTSSSSSATLLVRSSNSPIIERSQETTILYSPKGPGPIRPGGKGPGTFIPSQDLTSVDARQGARSPFRGNRSPNRARSHSRKAVAALTRTAISPGKTNKSHGSTNKSPSKPNKSPYRYGTALNAAINSVEVIPEIRPDFVPPLKLNVG